MGRVTNFDPTDIVGNRYGKLEVVKYIGKTERGHMYTCKCDCGNIIERTRGSLTNSAKMKSCGCAFYVDVNDIIGEKFHHWLVLDYVGVNSGNKHVYRCKCDCGTIKNIVRGDLTSGVAKSCGCYSHRYYADYNDIIGKRFGRLTVLNISRKEHNDCFYKCLCDCGNTTEKLRGQLMSGQVKSCGCLRRYNQTDKLSSINPRRAKKLPGIKFVEKKNKWCAMSSYNGVKYLLGWYDTVDEAIEAKVKVNNEIIKCGEVLTFIEGYRESDKTYVYPDKKVVKAGVKFNNKINKWQASILYHLEYFDLGTYETYEKAVAARELAEDEIRRYQEVSTYESRRNINEN